LDLTPRASHLPSQPEIDPLLFSFTHACILLLRLVRRFSSNNYYYHYIHPLSIPLFFSLLLRLASHIALLPTSTFTHPKEPDTCALVLFHPSLLKPQFLPLQCAPDYDLPSSYTPIFIKMSVVSLLGVNVLNNPAKFTDKYEFEITFECLEPLEKGSCNFGLLQEKKHSANIGQISSGSSLTLDPLPGMEQLD
jgi:hypothetical protein